MKWRFIVYSLIIAFCLVAIGMGVYQQFFYKNSDTDMLMLGTTIGTKAVEQQEKEEAIKNEFYDIFKNSLVYVTNNVNNKATRADMSKDLIYTVNQVSKVESGKYEMNINLPAINIVSQNAQNINKKIEDTFIPKATSLLTSTGGNYTIYNIDYAGFVNNNVLSLIIRATLKEGQNPQRVMFMTYNYNLDNGKLLTFNDILEMKSITTATMQNKINKEIQEISKKNQSFKQIGYSVFERNPNDSMYKVEETKLYFIGPNSDGYVLYAYGNTNNTSEVDIIIF